jgi:hypothetical protein
LLRGLVLIHSGPYNSQANPALITNLHSQHCTEGTAFELFYSLPASHGRVKLTRTTQESDLASAKAQSQTDPLRVTLHVQNWNDNLDILQKRRAVPGST